MAYSQTRVVKSWQRVLAVLATVDVSAEATKGALEREAHVGQQYVKHFNLLKSGEQVSFVVDEVNTYAYPYVSTPALDSAILKDMSGQECKKVIRNHLNPILLDLLNKVWCFSYHCI
jgi:hypothetical protein